MVQWSKDDHPFQPLIKRDHAVCPRLHWGVAPHLMLKFLPKSGVFKHPCMQSKQAEVINVDNVRRPCGSHKP